MAKNSNSSSVVNGSKSKVWFWAEDCRYSVILNQAKLQGWRLVRDEKSENKANIYWIDVSSIHERFKVVLPWQIVNHFPGMPNIARKNRMGQNLNKMLKVYPREYSFYPRTWVLPGEMADFKTQFDENGNALQNKIFIIKPDAGCQGRGIFLTTSFKNVPLQENVVAQVYMKKPLLLDGFKFDLRIYVCVFSVKPLRIYLFKDGLVRICTEPYSAPTKSNISHSMMHLTNYAVNKHNSNFHQPTAGSDEPVGQEDSSKRSLHWFMNFVKENYGEKKVTSLWNRIGTVCVRTLLTVMPTLSREYDFHFKHFKNIPVKVPPPAEGTSGSGPSSAAASSSNNNKSKNNKKNLVKLKSKSKSKTVDSARTDESEDDDDEDEDGDDDDDDDDDDKSGETEETPVTSSSNPSTSQKSRLPSEYENIETRGSRCFEVLGLDIMIDSNLKPWLIEVNHLPSFGTDSPLDLDVKDRLMAQVLPCIAALADDEAAYIRHQKNEAAKRLTKRRAISETRGGSINNTNNNNPIQNRSNSKPPVGNRQRGTNNGSITSTSLSPPSRKPNAPIVGGTTNIDNNPDENSETMYGIATTNSNNNNNNNPHQGSDKDEERRDETDAERYDNEPDNEQEQENDHDMTILRNHLDEDGAIRVDNIENIENKIIEDIHQQAEAEAAEAAIQAEENNHNNEDGKDNIEDPSTAATSKPPPTPERLEQIKNELREIYEICSPEKITKIDRLLHKYLGREEEFLEFVHIKYCVPIVDQSTLSTGQLASSGVSTNGTLSSISEDKDSGKKDDIGNKDFKNSSILKRPVRASINNNNNTTKPIVHPPFRGGGTFGRRTIFDDNISSGNGRRAGSDQFNDSQALREQMRADILAEHVSTEETDPWMVRESKFLKEFIRLFPLPGKPVNNNNNKRDGNLSRQSSDISQTDEDDDDDDDYTEEGDESTATTTPTTPKIKKKKKPSASYEDIMCSVFELDRRLLMRFQRPPRERSESADAANIAASKSTALLTQSTTLTSSSAKDVTETVKPTSVVISKTQFEAATRLSQGLSTLKISPSQYRDESTNQYMLKRPISPSKYVYIDGVTTSFGMTGPTGGVVSSSEIQIPQVAPQWVNRNSSRLLANNGSYVLDPGSSSAGTGSHGSVYSGVSSSYDNSAMSPTYPTQYGPMQTQYSQYPSNPYVPMTQSQYSQYPQQNYIGSAKLGLDLYKSPSGRNTTSGHSPTPQQATTLTRTPYILDREVIQMQHQPNQGHSNNQALSKNNNNLSGTSNGIGNGGAGILRQQVFQFDNRSSGADQSNNNNNIHFNTVNSGGSMYGNNSQQSGSFNNMLNISGNSFTPVGRQSTSNSKNTLNGRNSQQR